MNSADKIPLAEVAEDSREDTRVFREEEHEISYQDYDPVTVRKLFAAQSETGQPIASVQDHEVAVEGGTITVREYRPELAHSAAAILYLHGGGWIFGNLDTVDSLARLIAEQTGAAVFSVDYRLAPEFPFPAAVNDSKAALDWLLTNADSLNIDIDRIAVAGDSAGANLAAVLANEYPPERGQIAAQVLFYPCTDLSQHFESRDLIDCGFRLTSASMDWCIQHYVPEGEALENPLLSPLQTRHLNKAPIYLLSCGYDPLRDEAIAYANRVVKEGGKLEYHHLPRHPHGIMNAPHTISTAHAVALSTAAFLRKHLGIEES